MDSDLRRLRHGVSVLKKQGLIPARADSGIKIDARSVIPSMKVKGKRLDTLVRKFDDVVSGKATALKVNKKDLPKFRKAGFETARGRVIAPHSATETARLTPSGNVSIKSPSGIERVQIPIAFHNLRQYLRDIRKNSKAINAMKKRNEYFGIRFFGGQRANFYSDIQSLLDDLSRYDSIKNIAARTLAITQEEIYKNLEILRITPKGALKLERQLEERKQTMSKTYNRKHAKRQREKIKRDPEKLAAYRAAAAERSRKYRARRKNNSKATAKERVKARARQAKYRKSLRKGKK